MVFLYNSKDVKYKTPFGALCVSHAVRFVFPIQADCHVYGVNLVVKKYTGEEARVPTAQVSAVEAGFRQKSGVAYYTTDLVLAEVGIYYYCFEVYTVDGLTIVGRDECGKAKAGSGIDWQLTVYEESKDKKESPFKGGVIYHIFADRFCKAGEEALDKHKACGIEQKCIKGQECNTCQDSGKGEQCTHDVITVQGAKRIMKGWDELPTVVDPDGVFRANDFYGGNIKGILSKLDYIESLGVNIIYLSPIFKAASNHRYDTGDYFEIDPLFGTEAEFQELIDRCAERGIGIMIDGVFNHTGADSVYFNKFDHYDSQGAYQSKASPYYDWYHFSKFPDKYDCWWGITVVPTLNKANHKVRQLVRDVIKKWMPLGLKGLRLDVADELPSDYIFDIRRTVKSIDEDIYLLGEVWEDASHKVAYGTMRPYLLGRQLDSVMNYPFKQAILAYVKNNDKRQLAITVNEILENYPSCAVDMLMNIIGTHDTVRAINCFLDNKYFALSKTEKRQLIIGQNEIKKAVKLFKIAALLQFTLPGIPSVYYGDEVGLMGFEDPLNRATYPFGREDKDILEFYRCLGAFRKKYKNDLGTIEFVCEDSPLLQMIIANGKAKVVVNNSKCDEEYTFDKDCQDTITGESFEKGQVKTLGKQEYLLLV